MKKNFNEIYDKIYHNGIEELKNIKSKKYISGIICVVSTIVFVLIVFLKINNIAMLAITVLCLVISFLYNMLMTHKYKIMYKKCVIKTLVNAYDPNMTFEPFRGIGRMDYNSACYNERYDEFHTEDLIEGTILENISYKMSQITTIRIEYVTDRDGNRSKEEHTVFSGLFGMVDLGGRPIFPIEITYDSILNKFNSKRIEVDSAQFEKQYDLYSVDKVKTMEIFTADLIEKINDFKQETGYKIEMKIVGTYLYFRIPCRDVFEAPLFKSELDYSVLLKYFKLIDAPIEIITQLIENMDYANSK